MKTVVNTLEYSMKELVVTFEKEEWKKAQDKALDKLASQAQIDGFRKGNAPKALIKSKIGNKNIQNEAVDVILQDSYASLISDNKIEICGQPNVEILKVSGDELEVKITCPVNPEITLKQYKDLEVKKDVVEVTEQEIEDRLKSYQNDFAELVVKDKDAQAELGDTVTIDFEGFKDGVAFEGGKGENHPLELGSGSFIPGFEDQVVGMKVEEEKDIQVKFPEEYQAKELAGADAIFKVKVHEIKSKILPEIDDELAKDVNIEGVETLEDLKKNVESSLKATKETQVENKFNDELVDALIEANPFEVPEALIDQEVQQIVSEISSNFEAQGMSLDLYQKMTGQTMEQIRESVKEEAEKRVKYRLILGAIVKAENIVASEEDYQKEIKSVAEQYGREVSEIEKIFEGQKDFIMMNIAEQKAAKLVRESVK